MSATRHDERHLPSHKTKIVATLGPASRSRETVERMIAAGMSVARINFAHGTRDEHAETVRTVRAAAASVGRRVAVFGDLPGPKIRVGRIRDGAVELARGQSYILQAEPVIGDAERASVSLDRMPDGVKAGDAIYINDGFLQLDVEEVIGGEVHCRVVVGGRLSSHKGVNFPGVDLGIAAFTEQDAELLRLAVELGLDAVSQSFVRDADDVRNVRAAADDLGWSPFVIAKIERSAALDNLDEILGVADAIMVARGDLGVEIPIEQIASAQKRIIAASNLRGVPVITATHMLESMIVNSRPTRAEATDVANAILDGSDCLMLSGETAVGNHPVGAIHTTSLIAAVTERGGVRGNVFPRLERAKQNAEIARRDLVAMACYQCVETVGPAAVVTPTTHGHVPRQLTRFRIRPWIVAIGPDEALCQQLAFSYGVHPIHTLEIDGMIPRCRALLHRLGFEEGLGLLVRSEFYAEEQDSQHLDLFDLARRQI